MFFKIGQVLALLDQKSKTKLLIYSLLRMLVGIIDTFGVLLIGLLLSKSVQSVTPNFGNSESKLSRYLDFFSNFTLVQIAVIATFAFLVKSFFSLFLTKIMLDDFSKIEVNLAENAFSYMMKNISWTIKNYSKSDINFLLKSSIGSTVQMISAYVIVVSEFFFLITIFVSFLFIDAKITFFIVAYFAVIATFLHNFLGKRFKSAGIKSVTNEVSATTVIFDTMQSFREVISLKRENYFIDRFKVHKYNVAKASFDIQFYSSIPRYVVESSLLIGALVIVSFSLRNGSVQQSAETIGIFMTGSLKVMTSLLPLQTYFAQFKNQLEISQKYLDFKKSISNLNVEFENKESAPQNLKLLSPVGIRIKNLDFRYSPDDDLVLEKINLAIEPGQFVAIIGSSGSGKSTLADLIIGINKPTAGTVQFFSDSQQVISSSDFSFGYVPQMPGRIYGTIKENIAFGLNENEIDTQALIDSIKISQLDDVISNLEKGFDTHTGEQSDDLSGGQMQRIGLARALYEKPNLLVLDEATSALDVESEARVSRALENLRGRCTVIVIAHRLSTVKNADVVYVLESGNLIARGKFSDLAKNNQIVAKLVELSDLKAN